MRGRCFNVLTREWLVKARGSMTREDVSKLIGISRQYYSMIELGDRNPSVSVAKRIGEVLGINWTLFFIEERNAPLR
ncbi:helix-turn-helix transcriptional regulator [Brevibacillus laterosporus]|uniref:Helix-turn-helix transcriptional regulator n=1 Tax=Brevibacillus laterosporus TaxID=1465 RepID=A0AAP3DDG8_BRELA|nr:helix-turn-helix transcriptional regulator [Brevibacillus laterosporus]MCR8978730.1 helix-turn-helix transcriptional regulator [Brevibacillus laterosporus]MCZ0805886.1 helix-turn-helix transcriptional regulator [Brevibacillus laterosporus]MCZ0824348.1 helix-turn-helix transcriptional regulator [Brevibacillus laterosporus]MCZ0848252.1 helix-turn-helix transcriptional regulator [Brevibacillus laterosporus]